MASRPNSDRIWAEPSGFTVRGGLPPTALPGQSRGDAGRRGRSGNPPPRWSLSCRAPRHGPRCRQGVMPSRSGSQGDRRGNPSAAHFFTWRANRNEPVCKRFCEQIRARWPRSQGIETTNPRFSPRVCRFHTWSGRRDSNSRPTAWQGDLGRHARYCGIIRYNDRSDFAAVGVRDRRGQERTPTGASAATAARSAGFTARAG